jgi:1-acyl-sn-glycerol-3-phosphate acyltransferase
VKGILARFVGEKGFGWYGFCQALTIIFFLVFYRYRVHGRENVPARGAALIASNHQSFFDPVLVGLLLSRQISIMARESLFRVPGFAALIRSFNAFPVKRSAFNREAIRRSVEVLEEGRLLLLFPEGRRTRDGSLGAPKPGIALLARKAKVPVVPAVIHGAYKAWPPHRALFRLFVPIRVAFGAPLRADRGDRGSLEKGVAESWKRLRAAMEETRE